jgi:hypothetical protein
VTHPGFAAGVVERVAVAAAQESVINHSLKGRGGSRDSRGSG